MFGSFRMSGVVRLARWSLLVAGSAVVCSAQFPFWDSAEYAAKVISMSGQVSVLKDSQPWALNVGDQVQVKQIIITGPDGHALFQVSDGSTFEVYPNSNVVFRKNPPNWKDLLDVLVGRVRVHIQKFGNQPNPHRVLTPSAVISVRGTIFDVAVDDDDESTTIQVEEGQVAVRHALLPNSNEKILNPGESLRIYKNQPIAVHLIDRGTLARKAFEMLREAAYTLATRGRGPTGIPGAGGGSGPTLPGDTGKTPPPPAPPPAPPPPPPPN